MDLRTLVLGSVAPALAILGELWNPVSGGGVKTQALHNVEQFVPDDVKGGARDMQKNAIADTITGTAIGTAEISGLIPTWVGVITGLTAVFIEIVDPALCLAAVAVITAVTAVFGFRFFSVVNYAEFGMMASRTSICKGRTGSECISAFMILINFVVIVIMIAAWFLTDTSIGGKALRIIS